VHRRPPLHIHTSISTTSIYLHSDVLRLRAPGLTGWWVKCPRTPQFRACVGSLPSASGAAAAAAAAQPDHRRARCVPSRQGLLCECPHRQRLKMLLFRKLLPSASTITKSPTRRSGPASMILALTIDIAIRCVKCGYCGARVAFEVGAGLDPTALCGALGQLEKPAASCDASQNGSRADRPHRHSV